MSTCEDYHKRYLSGDNNNNYQEQLTEQQRTVLIQTHQRAKKVYEKLREQTKKKYNPNLRFYIKNDLSNLIEAEERIIDHLLREPNSEEARNEQI